LEGDFFIFVKNSNSLSPVTAIGTPFIKLDKVGSTNNYAMAQVQAHLAGHGATWFAWEQNEGKGQRGKSWKATPGLNLTMSCVVEPEHLKISNQFLLSALVALSCYDLLNAYAPYDVSIKWPNDLYWKDRKAGGILIENVIKGNEWKYAIIGIGININQVAFDEELINPVSLKQITGKDYDVVELAKQLCDCLEKRWQQSITDDAGNMLDEYEQKMFRRNEAVCFKLDNATIEARVIGVTPAGELLIDTGTPTAVSFGSVEWMIR
jgi:BirA family biotin operon repressor/biotin-[acetyl-CoA-carboxylase] ligase